MAMLQAIDDDDASDGSLFNMNSAQSKCLQMLRSENTKSYGSSLHSQPIFHLDELVKTACSSSTATSNHSELPSVQISGLRLLVSLFRAFGSQLDTTTNDGASVLDQYLSQIISSVKHALNAENMLNEQVPGTAFHRLFWAGCDALVAMISEELIVDPVAMKRLLQPVLLKAEETPFVEFPIEDGTGKDALLMSSSHVTDDSRSYPLFRLSKLCFYAKISTQIALGEIQESTASMIAVELEKEELGRAIHCAAAAIDGFLLQDSSSAALPSGLTYKNRIDLGESVADALAEYWPVLCASAITSIVKAMIKGENNMPPLQEWLKKLIPLVVSGLRSSLPGDGTSLLGKSSTETATLCVYALRLLVNDNAIVGDCGLCAAELGDIANAMTQSVIFDSLCLPDSPEKSEQPPMAKGCHILVKQACGLVEDLCEQYSTIGVDASVLTRAAVTPLVALQEKRIRADNVIMSSCIRSCQKLLKSHPDEGRSEFEKALLQLVLSILKDAIEEEMKAACLSLLQSCCNESTLSHEEWGHIAMFTAACGSWDAWAVVCSALPPGYGIKCSIDAIKSSLGDLQSCPRHANALVALRTALHSASGEDPSLLGFVLQNVGCEILQLLRAHASRIIVGQGFDDHRVSVCTESIKVNIMAFQYLTSVSAEEDNFVSFISTLFEVLVESIIFNGLPNHPSGKGGADETIGRMCAQVFVHVARTTPMVFKSSMTVIKPESRSILESAVRADMSGYAAPKREAKKKISIKGFVR